jgi:hypothetical protein
MFLQAVKRKCPLWKRPKAVVFFQRTFCSSVSRSPYIGEWFLQKARNKNNTGCPYKCKECGNTNLEENKMHKAALRNYRKSYEIQRQTVVILLKRRESLLSFGTDLQEETTAEGNPTHRRKACRMTLAKQGRCPRRPPAAARM